MIRKWTKRIAIFFSILLLLIFSVLVFLHTPWGRAIVRDKAVSYLEKKLKTKVSIGDVDYRLPNWIQLKRILILDQQQDTLLAGGNLYVRLNMIQLLSSNIQVGAVELENIALNIKRRPDEEEFNYQFISDAFTSTSPPPPDTTTKKESKPIKLSVHSILLDHVSLSMNDYKDKQYFSAGIQLLKCSPGPLNLAKNSFDFEILSIAGTYIQLVDSTGHQKKTNTITTNDIAPASASENNSLPLLLALKKLDLSKVKFSYKKPAEKIFIDADLDRIMADSLLFDPTNKGLSCNNFDLNNSKLCLSIWTPDQSSASQDKASSSPNEKGTGLWPIYVKHLSLHNNSFAYHNEAIAPIEGFDPNHIDAGNIDFLSGGNRFVNDEVFSVIEHCSITVNNKYHLKKLRGEVQYTSNGLQLKDLAVMLNNSQLVTKGNLVWPAQANASPICTIENTELSYEDLIDFQPSLKQTIPISISPKEKIKLSGTIRSQGKSLVMENVQLGTKGFKFSGSATMQNINGNNFSYHASIRQLDVNKNLLSPSLLDQLKKQNLSLPENIALSGTVIGDTKNITTDLKLNSSYGQVKIKGRVENLADVNQMSYNLRVDANGLETGKWINSEDQLGKLTGTINLKGKGAELGKIKAEANTKIGSLVVNGYRYSNIQLKGLLNGSAFNVNSQINDPHLVATISSAGNIIDGYPSLSGIVSIDTADLQSLGFTTDTFNVSGIINIDSLNTNPDFFVALMNVNNALLYTQGKQARLDSLELKAHSKKEGTELALASPWIAAHMNTSYTLTQATVLVDHLMRIYKQEKIPAGSEGWMNINASIQQDSILNVFVPGLTLIEPVEITGKLEATNDVPTILMEATAPALKYDDISATALMIHANSIDSGQLFTVAANSLVSGTDSFYHPAIRGIWKDSNLLVAARIEDKLEKEFYALKTFITFGASGTTIQLPEDQVLNYAKWKVSDNNKIKIFKDGIIADHFSLAQDKHSISINSLDPLNISPLQIKLDSVDVATLARLASLGDSVASGNLDVDVTIQQPLEKFPSFTGRASVTNFVFQNATVGNFELNSKSRADSLELEGKLSGANEAYFSGSIHPSSGSLDVNANIRKLDVALLYEFIRDYFSRAYGTISGNLHMGGTINRPQYTGTIHIDSTGLALAEFYTLYKIDKQTLVFNYPSLQFGNFIITDSSGNKLSVNGDIKMIALTEYGLNLGIQTKNFVALNSKRQPGSSIYGKGIVDADVKISGSSNEPGVKGTIKLLPASDIHYIFEQNRAYTKGSERIRFVNIDTIPLPGDTSQAIIDSIKKIKTFKGLVYNLNLDISKDAQFSMVINPANNDELLIKGEGQLNMGIGEGGEAAMTGVYRLQSGYYNMNNQFLRGKFLLVKGSTISFNGDPMDAVADISTEYEVKATPQGLLNSNDDDLPGATERIPFMITLKIKGPISKPDLSFDIRLKNNLTGNSALETAIDNELVKLRIDPTELNKQVFSLLVMSQFTLYGSEADFASSNFNADAALRAGMSQFLMEAMNQVADGLIKGVDVNVNFNNYYSNDNSSTRTDLGVSLSKDVSDRVTVSIGKNFSMGETVQNTYAKASDQYIPDITTAYKLSKDGRYFVKAYRKTEYDAVVEGYFAETGVSFTIQMDYNRFKELFTPAKKLQQNP